MRRTQAFTLIELLVVVSIIALLVGILVPSLGQALEKARQSSCAVNLNSLGKGLTLYAGDDPRRSRYPCLGDSDTYDEEAEAYEELEDFYGTAEDPSDAADCNIQAWWLLVLQETVQDDAFICPSDDSAEEVTRDREHRYGFRTWRNVSYGLQLATRSEYNDAYLGAPGQKDKTVIAGDRIKPDMSSDPMSDVEKVNSSVNHLGDGGSYLSKGSNVKWQDDKSDRAIERGEFFGDFGTFLNNVFLIDLDENNEISTGPNAKGGHGPSIKMDSGTDLINANDSFLHWRDQRESD